jgi:hypothetical protein
MRRYKQSIKKNSKKERQLRIIITINQISLQDLITVLVDLIQIIQVTNKEQIHNPRKKKKTSLKDSVMMKGKSIMTLILTSMVATKQNHNSLHNNNNRYNSQQQVLTYLIY